MPIRPMKAEICVTDGSTFRIGSNGMFQLNTLNPKPLTIQTPPSGTIDDVRDQLRSSSAALAGALRSFGTETKPVYTTSVLTTSSPVATPLELFAKRMTAIDAPSAPQ